MPTRNVVVTDHQAELIEGLVKSGRYQNASEVLREGLRLVEQREQEDAAKLERLRAAVQVGIDAMERGEYTEFESMDDLERHLNALAEEAISGATKSGSAD
ncbi:type II toxin-antitoxin system ParD family antitoxin [Inquilinus sp. CA228]|uniref:type II toxin-antitoxin system ParD family antitoxin n=1 Tax=Inquilinus sp. CA228 TaxID=3455609 RepID=UPI003F8D0BA5